MTTERATPDSPQAARAPRGPSKRVLVLLAAAVVLAGGWYFRKPLVLWPLWINGSERKDNYDRLLQEEDPAVLPRLEDGMRDADKADVVRLACASLLIGKNRLAVVEAGLRDPRIDVRAVALGALGNLRHFQTEYVDNPSYEVQKTLLAWIGDPTSPSRWRGIDLVPKVFPIDRPPPPELLATLRGVLRPSETAGSDSARAAAAAKLASFKDCAAAPDLVALATSESEPHARWLILRSTVQLFESSAKTCPEQLPEAGVRKAVVEALSHRGDGDRSRSLRMGAMSILARHPEWSAEAVDRVRGFLENLAVNEVERRTALETMVALKDPATLDRFERWCHDPAAGVRATATSSIYSKAPGLDPNRLLSCVVGYLIAEPAGGYELTFNMAFAHVRQKAGEWVGLPGRWRTSGGSLGDVQKGLKDLQSKGSLDGTSRAQVGDALFRWLGKANGLSEAEIDAAQAARAQFWAKAQAGDVAGARAVYDASMQKNGNLWTFELGWIEAHAK